MVKTINDIKLKNEVIEKAIEIFSIKGFASTKLTDITDALDISRGPIYYYFKDKYGLYKAVYDFYDEDVRASHRDIVAKDQPLSDFIEDAIFDCTKRNIRYGPNLFVGLDEDEKLKDVYIKFQKLNDDIYTEKLDYVKRSIEKGEVRVNTDSRRIADLIYIVYNGLLSSIQHDMLQSYTEDEIRDLTKYLIKGIEIFYSK